MVQDRMNDELTRFRHFISTNYNLEEIRTLCFDLKVDYDELKGETKSVKVVELLLLLGRERKFEWLLSELQRTRPKMLVDEIGEDPTFAQKLYAQLSFLPNAENNRNTTESSAFKPGSAPPLPSLMVGREDDLQTLKTRLMATKSRDSLPIQILTAVRGLPGVGKTTIASALAHDPEIKEAFPDGVLWVSLGQSPNMLSELATWGRALGTDEISYIQSLEEAHVRVNALLRDKAMLLIIDDVWEAKHAASIMVGGSRCALLLTTRLNNVAYELAPTPTDIYSLPILTDDKAFELLQLLAPTVVEQYPNETSELARELEGLPLALQVAGRLLNAEANYGFGVADLLTELRDGTKLLAEKAPRDRAALANESTPTVAALLQKSTDLLETEIRDRFAFLGAFAPKPATFDLFALNAMWQIDNPERTIRILVDRGLLEPINETDRFQLHALLVMHAKSLLAN